jgi:hypothetical protein
MRRHETFDDLGVIWSYLYDDLLAVQADSNTGINQSFLTTPAARCWPIPRFEQLRSIDRRPRFNPHSGQLIRRRRKFVEILRGDYSDWGSPSGNTC